MIHTHTLRDSYQKYQCTTHWFAHTYTDTQRSQHRFGASKYFRSLVMCDTFELNNYVIIHKVAVVSCASNHHTVHSGIICENHPYNKQLSCLPNRAYTFCGLTNFIHIISIETAAMEVCLSD